MRGCVLALAVSVCALPEVGGPPRRETERLKKDKGALERRASGEAERADEQRRLADCNGYGQVLLPRHECPRSLNFPDVPVGLRGRRARRGAALTSTHDTAAPTGAP